MIQEICLTEMCQRKKSVASPTLPNQIEFEVTCYVNPPDGSRRTSRYEDTFHTKQFRIEIAFCNKKYHFSRTQTSSVCRYCKGALLREFSQRLERSIAHNEVEILLKHETTGKMSNFRFTALLGSDKECGSPREEDICPLCRFVLSPLDRAGSLSQQSLSRSGDLRTSPSCPTKHPAKKNFHTGDAPFATEVTPQGEIIQKRSRPVSARPNFVTGDDLQLKSSRDRPGGIQRQVSMTLSKLKYAPCPVCYAQRPKASEHSRR